MYTYRLRILFIFPESLPFFETLVTIPPATPPPPFKRLRSSYLLERGREKNSKDEDTVKDHVCNVA
jgi:hypothetical protein